MRQSAAGTTPLLSSVSHVFHGHCMHMPSKFHINKEFRINVSCMHASLFFFFSPVGLGVLSHTLTPRMKASHIALQTMRGHLDAVYDITVAYEGSLDASRQRKPAPSMPGERSICPPASSRPAWILLCHIFFFRGALSVEAVCHPVLVSLVGSKHFCPFMTPFLLFYFAVSWQRRAQKQPVIMAASLRTAPLCIVPLFAFQFQRAHKQVRVAARKRAKHVGPLVET